MRYYQANSEISSGRFTARLAVTKQEIDAAFMLRFEIFNMELHEGLPGSYLTGMDRDIYDDYCDHLVVIDNESEKIVGTYRMLPGIVAENSIGYYSETEFNLTAIRQLPGAKLELGRSCVHRNFRTASVIRLLWQGIASYVERYGIRHVFGCSSLHTSVPAEASLVYSYLYRFHRADDQYTVTPIRRLTDVQMLPFCDRKQAFEVMPPLMKGYLRVGAQICGQPAYDSVFGTTDFLILLDTEKLLGRYRKKFFSEKPQPQPACAF